MNIVLVSYAHLFNLGNYENERIEASSAVRDGEDEIAVLAELKEWVFTQGNRAKDAFEDARASEERSRAALRDLDRIQADLNLAQAKWGQVRAFLDRTGIGLPQGWQEEDIPF